MNLVDVAHRSLVLGLFGITVYYGAFVVNRSGDVVKRYNAAKAAREEEMRKAQAADPQQQQQQ